MDDSEIITGLLKYLDEKFNVRGLESTNFVKITQGWETDIYIVSIKLNSQDNLVKIPKSVVLRMYSGEHASHNALAEFNTLKTLFQANYSVPEVYFMEKSSNIVGKPFILMEEIKGKTLESYLTSGSEQERQDFFNLYIQKFIDLHDLDWTQLVSNPERYLESPNRLIDEYLENYYQGIKKYNMEEFQEVQRWIQTRLHNIECNKLAVIHRDYHPMNILINEQGLPFVIDWHKLTILDFRLDLAWTLILSQSHGSKEQRDRILQKYEDLKGFQIKDLEFFEVIALFIRLGENTASVLVKSKGSMKDESILMSKEVKEAFKKLFQMLFEITKIKLPKMEKILLGI
jgi:aminoglycoside phosphotransferase (APT) family kinase protein